MGELVKFDLAPHGCVGHNQEIDQEPQVSAPPAVHSIVDSPSSLLEDSNEWSLSYDRCNKIVLWFDLASSPILEAVPASRQKFSGSPVAVVAISAEASQTLSTISFSLPQFVISYFPISFFPRHSVVLTSASVVQTLVAFSSFPLPTYSHSLFAPSLLFASLAAVEPRVPLSLQHSGLSVHENNWEVVVKCCLDFETGSEHGQLDLGTVHPDTGQTCHSG